MTPLQRKRLRDQFEFLLDCDYDNPAIPLDHEKSIAKKFKRMGLLEENLSGFPTQREYRRTEKGDNFLDLIFKEKKKK